MTSSSSDLPSTADRAMRVLSDIAGDSRPRTAADADDPSIPVAATVVLLRDDADGLRVLLLQRPDRGSFAGAWVFPGGKVDEGDREPDDGAEEAPARRAGIRETREETGLVLDPRALETLSVWDPPPGLPLRIRTWFYLAPAPDGALTLSEGEVAQARWLAPRTALEMHARGELSLYPPTWVTLHGLTEAASADAALSEARLAGLRRFESVARRGPSGPVMLWADDSEYEEGGVGERRHRLEIGALPWRYTRSG